MVSQELFGEGELTELCRFLKLLSDAKGRIKRQAARQVRTEFKGSRRPDTDEAAHEVINND